MQIHKHIKAVVDKYRAKFTKDALKKYFKEISKKIVSYEYKQNRVSDPTKDVDRDKARSIKMKVKEYLDKALYKERKAARQAGQKTPDDANGVPEASTPADGPDADVVMSDVETGSASSQERKRKREAGREDVDSPMREASETPSAKRFKEDEGEPAPPPPPPPPPESGLQITETEALATQQADLLEQEKALMLENEEAERLEAVARHSTEKGQANLTQEGLDINGHAVNGVVFGSGQDGSNEHGDQPMTG